MLASIPIGAPSTTHQQPSKPAGRAYLLDWTKQRQRDLFFLAGKCDSPGSPRAPYNHQPNQQEARPMKSAPTLRRRFPAEFEDLLNSQGRKLLAGQIPEFLGVFRSKRDWYAGMPGIMTRDTANRCIRLLDAHLYSHLRRIDAKIPREEIWNMKTDYSDSLPKSMLTKSADLNVRRSKALQAAHELGLMEMLQSESFRTLAQVISGFSLSKNPCRQVLCYETGCYVGPHNDHHPESDHFKNGYVDLQLTLSNDGVDHQWLIYERNGHLNGSINIGVKSLVSAYWLPFWHYTTPLRTRLRARQPARRWLILGTFDYANKPIVNPKARRAEAL